MSAAKPVAGKPSQLLRIMYSSVTQTAWNKKDMQSLFAQCVKNNKHDDITGVLMVDGVLNIQYIEGPELAIRSLWQRLCEDSRHHLIVQLYEEEGMLPRLFGQWAMLHGQSSRAEMLSLIRNSYLAVDTIPKPAWSLAMAPLIILLDSNYAHAYAKAAL